MQDKIQLPYKEFIIEFDTYNEEWIAKFEDSEEILKRNTSLKKLKESIDRFLTKSFIPIPISYFDSNQNFIQADIISFTDQPGECWIKKTDDSRHVLKTAKKFPTDTSVKNIYAAGNVYNEPILLKIFDLQVERQVVEEQLTQINKEIISLISSLATYDITGFTSKAL